MLSFIMKPTRLFYVWQTLDRQNLLKNNSEVIIFEIPNLSCLHCCTFLRCISGRMAVKPFSTSPSADWIFHIPADVDTQNLLPIFCKMPPCIHSTQTFFEHVQKFKNQAAVVQHGSPLDLKRQSLWFEIWSVFYARQRTEKYGTFPGWNCRTA